MSQSKKQQPKLSPLAVYQSAVYGNDALKLQEKEANYKQQNDNNNNLQTTSNMQAKPNDGNIIDNTSSTNDNTTNDDPSQPKIDAWAESVDYGDDDDDDDNNDVDDDHGYGMIDYGDDDDDDDDDINIDPDSIGDLNLSDDDDLPPQSGLATQNTFKAEITSTLNNPYNIPVSYTLELDTKDTSPDYSDDDESAVGLKINNLFKLTTKKSDDIKDDNNNSDDALLGSGSFAKVYRARNLKTGKLVALKVMYKNLLRKQFMMKSTYNLDDADDDDDDDDDVPPTMTRYTMLDAVQIELQIMLTIKHINLVKLYYIIDDPSTDLLYLSIEYSSYGQVMDFSGKLLQYIASSSITDDNIITNNNIPQMWWYKYVEKDINKHKLINSIHRFNENISRKLFIDCVSGISYLHSNLIIHRDLKPENLLLFRDNNHSTGYMVKIADFGTAEQFQSIESAYLVDTQGTYHFMSPSAIIGNKRNAFHDDIWALGCCLFIFIFGTIPYHHPLDYQLFEIIQKEALILPDNNILTASNNVRDLINKLLVKDDDKRIKLDDIPKHPWYDNYDLPVIINDDDNNNNDNK